MISSLHSFKVKPIVSDLDLKRDGVGVSTRNITSATIIITFQPTSTLSIDVIQPE